MRLKFLIAAAILSGTAAAQTFTSSNLPIVIINTGGQSIPDEPKITATMGIIYNGPGAMNNLSDPPNEYNGTIGIETRGSSSQLFPKKSYGLETRTPTGADTNVSLLGMPSENDWILSANYTDKSLLNNVLAYRLANDFGNYASRTCFVELVLNGSYRGIYILMEKIKRDDNRVKVAKLKAEDTAGADVTGGYILKIDKTTGSSGTGGFESDYLPLANANGQKIFFQYEYPSDAKIHPKQKQYIEAFVDSFEYALKNAPLYDTMIGWRRFANEKSFVRYFLLNELSKNVDGYRISTFLYKKKITDGNKLFVGPVWDYDIAFGNADYCGGDVDTGWAYRFGDVCPWDGMQIPFWWQRLMGDTLFQNKLKCAYTEYRSTFLDTVQLFGWIDSMAGVLNNAQIRNFTKWPILGTYVWPNPHPIPQTYAGEIAELKGWLRKRLAWLDAHIPGTCWPEPTASPTLSFSSECNVYPNPFSSQITIRLSATTRDLAEVQLLSIDGKVIHSSSFELSAGTQSYLFPVADGLMPGMYLLRIRTNHQAYTFRLLHQK